MAVRDASRYDCEPSAADLLAGRSAFRRVLLPHLVAALLPAALLAAGAAIEQQRAYGTPGSVSLFLLVPATLGAAFVVMHLVMRHAASSMTPVRQGAASSTEERSAPLRRAGLDRDQAAGIATALFAASPVGIILADLGGRVHQANDTFLRIIGRTREALEGNRIRWDAVTPPEWLPRDEAAIAMGLAQGYCPPYEKEYVRPDGTRVPVLVSFGLIDRATSMVAAYVVDLSERRTAEAHFRALVEALPGLVFVADAAGRNTFVNARYREFTGLQEEILLGDGWLRIIHPEDRARATEDWQRALHRGDRYEGEYRVRRADGSFRWLNCRGVPVRAANGRVERWYGVCSDVTEHKAAEEALAASEAFLRSVLDASTDCVKVVDGEGRLTFMNAHGLCGMEIEEFGLVAGREWAELWPASQQAEVRAAVDAALAGATRRFEAPCPTAKGTAKWWDVVVAPLRDGAGGCSRVLAVSRDITRRRAAEAAHRESEERLRLAAESVGLAIMDANLDSGEVTCSDAMLDLIGVPKTDEVPVPLGLIRGVVHPEDRATVIEESERAEREGDVGHTVHRILRSDNGAQRWVESFRRISRGPDGARHLLGLQIDATSRMEAAEALRASEAFARSVLDATADCVTVIDTAGRVEFMNEPARLRAGLCEVVGVSVERLWPSEAGVELRAAIGQALGGASVRFAIQTPAESGAATWWDMAVTPVPGPDGQPARLLLVARDVTEQRMTEDALRQMADDLEARVRAEVAAREAAQSTAVQAQKMQALGQLAGGVAHDLNNVLQAVSGGASLIARRAEEPEQVRRLTGMLQDAATRGASVTGRLLAFARRGELRATPLDPAALVAGVGEVLSHTLGANVTVELACDLGLPRLLADRGQLETALVNLATNARDAMPEGGRITLAIEGEVVTPGVTHPAGLRPGHYLRLSVRDTGQGMDAATLARAAEPFFTTKPKGKGTGLGLPMAKGFAEQSGGGLHVVSEPGHGTTVSMWLPESTASDGPADAPAAGRVPPHTVSAPRVLVVDDEEAVREVVAGTLETRGFVALTAADGRHALALLGPEQGVDLLLTDLSMPGIDGIEVIGRARELRPRLPAILLTGYASDALESAIGDTLRGGPFLLLRKPVEPAELADRVGALLHGADHRP
jgi:PAS domain S-box-containing protein